jgi:serine/threonine-protein kinase
MAAVFDRLKVALSHRYTILRELGAGGMATVYLAEDLKHHRQVAIKVLRPELASALGPERFLREIEIVAKLTHPHILPLHDSGEADGFLFYVMPYVEGESLRDRISREKQLPIDDALKIASEVADALSFAHHQNIIHRDIKPENILLEAKHAVVADFGVARAIEEAGETRLTETGMAVGTPTYLSPEQASADRELDGRSDVYALGCVLYEMLAGEPPFTGPTAESVVHKLLTAEPPAVAAGRPSLPEVVVATVSKSLEKAPADRYQTAEEMGQALNAALLESAAHRVEPKRKTGASINAMLGAGLLMIAVVVVVWLQLVPAAPNPAEKPRLAVLPLGNLGSPDDEYFADGLTEEITNRLVQLSGLTVISRTSTILYKNHDKTLPQIGDEPGVDYVLEGTIRTDRASTGTGQARVTQQLIRVEDDAHLWSDGYTVELLPGEIFAVQADIAENVAQALGVALLEPERQALESRPTDNAEAFDYYLRGREYSNRGYSREDLEIAAQMYQSAVDLDPGFALALAQLSRVHALMYWFYYDRSGQRLVDAKEAADSASKLEPDLPEAHLALGYYYYHGFRDYDQALEQFAIAERSRPNDADLLESVGLVQLRQGAGERALENLERAAALNPRSLSLHGNLGSAYLALRHYPEAVRTWERALSLAPDIVTGYAFKVLTYMRWRGVTDQTTAMAREALEQTDVSELLSWLTSWFDQRALFRIDDEYRQAVDGLTAESLGGDSAAYYLAKAVSSGQRNQPDVERECYDSARIVLEAQVQERPEDAKVHARLGLSYAGLGRKEEAIAEGERAAALLPVARDAAFGPLYVQNLAEVYVMVGEYEAALDQIDYLLSIPCLVSVPLLQADPLYDPLRDLPRFQTLLEQYAEVERR